MGLARFLLGYGGGIPPIPESKAMQRSLLLLAALAASALPLSAQAERIVGLTEANRIVIFDSATPTNTGQARAITGLGGQSLVGIDVRPADGQLYGLGNSGGVFRISLADGNAVASLVSTLVDAAGAPVALSGTNFGIDFNPVPDRLRVVSDADQNLRINVDTGVTLTDGTLAYVDGNAGTNPEIVDAAYTNSFTPSPRTPPPGTQLFYLDSNLNQLVTTANPNAGELTAVGAAGNPSPNSGLDISGVTGTTYAFWDRMGGLDGFFTLNLAGGVLTADFIGDGTIGIADIAVAPAQTPTPATLALLGLGALALVARRRR